MSQNFFQIFRSQISDLKTDNVDYLKKPPWKKNFFDIFVIHLSSRYEKRCRMLQRLFSLFQGSKNQLWNYYFEKPWPFCIQTSKLALKLVKLSPFCIKETFRRCSWPLVTRLSIFNKKFPVSLYSFSAVF